MAQNDRRHGPKDWDLQELENTGAINVRSAAGPTIAKSPIPLLKIFQNWNVTPEEAALLKSSIALASNLVRVGLPYIATFLPQRDEIFGRGGSCPNEIPLKEDVSEEDIAAALEALDELAPSVEWQVNYDMYASRERDSTLGWIGITRLVRDEQPWSVLEPDDIEAADTVSKRKNLKYRPLIIGIMGEYVTALRNAPENSEQQLRATFMAGITMAHEIGHAIFHQDFRSFNPPTLTEPYVGKARQKELGVSFITWIFDSEGGGYHPNSAESIHNSVPEFTSHLAWVQHYSTDLKHRPLYKTLYAIPVVWIEDVLRSAWWDSLPPSEHLISFSAIAKDGLKPQIDPNAVATASIPNWNFSLLTGRPEWKREWALRFPGYEYGDKVRGLSAEEIEWQKAKDPKLAGKVAGVFFQGLSDAQIRHRLRVERVMEGAEDDSEDEDDFEDFGQHVRVKQETPSPVFGPGKPQSNTLDDAILVDVQNLSLRRPKTTSIPILSPTHRGTRYSNPISISSSSTNKRGNRISNPILIPDDDDPKAPREVDVPNDAAPTFTEVLLSVEERATILDHVAQVGRGSANPENAQPVASGLALLEEIEGFEASQEDGAQGFVDEYGGDNLMYPAPGRSHMMDLFYAVNGKRKERDDGGGAQENKRRAGP